MCRRDAYGARKLLFFFYPYRLWIQSASLFHCTWSTWHDEELIRPAISHRELSRVSSLTCIIALLESLFNCMRVLQHGSGVCCYILLLDTPILTHKKKKTHQRAILHTSAKMRCTVERKHQSWPMRDAATRIGTAGLFMGPPP